MVRLVEIHLCDRASRLSPLDHGERAQKQGRRYWLTVKNEVLSLFNDRLYLSFATYPTSNSHPVRDEALWVICVSLGYNTGRFALFLWELLTVGVLTFWETASPSAVIRRLWVGSWITSFFCMLFVADIMAYPQPLSLFGVGPALEVMILFAMGGALLFSI